MPLHQVLLVKKSYSERHHRNRRRVWKLDHMTKESDAGVMRGRHFVTEEHEEELEEFMQELEEDPTLRSQINLYKDADAMEDIAARKQKVQQMQQRPPAAAAAAAGIAECSDDDDEYDDDDDDDFPDVELNELLDELTLGGEGEGEEEEEEEAAPPQDVPAAPVSFAPAGAMQTPGINPHAPVEQFVLPGASDASPKFHF